MCRMSVEDAKAVAAIVRDPNEIWSRRQRALARGRMLHAVAMGGALRRAGGCLAWLIRVAVVAPLRCAFRRRSDTLFLLSMNDRMLADIGLMRADVQALACGVVPVGHLAPAATEVESANPVGPLEELPPVLPERLPQAA
jgi:uncharacterized protein YjiS (DUF1127 family)